MRQRLLAFSTPNQYAWLMNTSIATSNPIDSPQSANNSYPTTKNANSKNGKKILIADDEQYIRELYEEVLSSEGYSVEGVADGKTALEKISEGGWDLITLDVIMPKLDGLGILTKLEETPPKKKNGPIILLTSLANDPAVLEAQKKVPLKSSSKLILLLSSWWIWLKNRLVK